MLLVALAPSGAMAASHAHSRDPAAIQEGRSVAPPERPGADIAFSVPRVSGSYGTAVEGRNPAGNAIP